MRIAIIKNNKECINVNCIENIDNVKKKIDYQIDNLIYDYITFEQLNGENKNENLLEILSKHLDISQVLMSYNCYYTNDYLYQTIFVEGNDKSQNINYLGTQLANGIINLDTVILIKNKIIDNDKCELVSITDYDIKEIMLNKIVKKGVIISYEDDINEIEFMQSPLEKYSYDLCKERYRCYEIKIYNIILGIYYDITEKEKINKIGSIMLNKLIYGTIMVSMSIEDSQINSLYYLNLDKDYFMKIKKLLYIKNYNTDYNKYENSTFANIYRCINNEYSLYKENEPKILEEIEKIDGIEIINKIL